jgi:hypothetical protein
MTLDPPQDASAAAPQEQPPLVGHVRATHSHMTPLGESHAHGEGTMLVYVQHRQPHHHCDDKCIAGLEADLKALKRELFIAKDGLNDCIQDVDALRTENETLRAALRRIADGGYAGATFIAGQALTPPEKEQQGS